MENRDAQPDAENTDGEEITPSDKRLIGALRRLPLETRKRGLQELEDYLAHPAEHIKALQWYAAKQHEHNKARYITHPEESEHLDRCEQDLDRKLTEDPSPQLRKHIRLTRISLEE